MNVVGGRVMVRGLNGHTVLFVPGMYLGRMTLPALFRVDLQTDRQQIVQRGGAETQSWLVDESGAIAVEEDYFDREQRWVIRILRDGKLREVAYGHEAIEYPQILGFGPQPDTLLVQSMVAGDSVWRLLSLKDGALLPSFPEGAGLSEPIEDPANIG